MNIIQGYAKLIPLQRFGLAFVDGIRSTVFKGSRL